MTTQAETTQTNHRRAVRFFWGLLIGATLVSLVGNITHAVLPCIPQVVVQIGAAAVPPITLLAAVHGIALAVRAGASGRIYSCALGAVAGIGVGAFVVSFLALRDLMRAIGYSSEIASVFPGIIDTAVAVSTMMLVALGDKPARRTRTVATSANTQISTVQRLGQLPPQSTKAQLVAESTSVRPQTVKAELAQTTHDSAQIEARQGDANLALELIASGVTTQPIETVIAVLAATRAGATINAAARASRINYRTAQRIVGAAAEQLHRQLVAVR